MEAALSGSCLYQEVLLHTLRTCKHLALIQTTTNVFIFPCRLLVHAIRLDSCLSLYLCIELTLSFVLRLFTFFFNLVIGEVKAGERPTSSFSIS